MHSAQTRLPSTIFHVVAPLSIGTWHNSSGYHTRTHRQRYAGGVQQEPAHHHAWCYDRVEEHYLRHHVHVVRHHRASRPCAEEGTCRRQTCCHVVQESVSVASGCCLYLLHRIQHLKKPDQKVSRMNREVSNGQPCTLDTCGHRPSLTAVSVEDRCPSAGTAEGTFDEVCFSTRHRPSVLSLNKVPVALLRAMPRRVSYMRPCDSNSNTMMSVFPSTGNGEYTDPDGWSRRSRRQHSPQKPAALNTPSATCTRPEGFVAASQFRDTRQSCRQRQRHCWPSLAVRIVVSGVLCFCLWAKERSNKGRVLERDTPSRVK